LVQPQVEDVPDLLFREAIPAVDEPRFVANQNAKLLNRAASPRHGQQLALRILAIARIPDDPDEIVEIRQGDEIALELLRFDFRLAEEKSCASQNDFAPVLDVTSDRVLQPSSRGFP
jgi:hypothetical protein